MSKQKFTTTDWISILIAAVLSGHLGYDAHQHHMGVMSAITIAFLSFSGTVFGFMHLMNTAVVMSRANGGQR